MNRNCRVAFRGGTRKTTNNGGGLIVADWPTHKVKARRKGNRKRYLKRKGLLTYASAERDAQRGQLRRDVGVV